MRKSRLTFAASLLAACALTLTACGSSDDADSAETAAESAGEEAAEGKESFEVYALLPQGNDQPYGTTYLPPMEAMAKELGVNLTITNSEYDADKQASECEVAVAAQPARREGSSQ